MDSAEIRQTFLEFFREREHRVWPSGSLIPNDPTVLLTVAGMVQFKPYFLGDAVPEQPRAASVQKCVRIRGKLDDIDIVGTTTRHLTFFEMLGNFSFGDYFKREAIRWAWQLSTEAFGFDPARIWVSIYEDDDEAAELWQSETAVPAERVVRRGADDNFWSMGAAGPCGPCSELFYDRGPDHGPDGGPEVDETRFMEFWNLVFMQFEQDDDGAIVGELPSKNVDTGLGMERLAMLLQDVPNVYETDVIRPILDAASDVTGVAYGQQEDSDVSLRVLADHARSTSFLVADGVLPSNEARGYVLRRLLRRMVLHARQLGGPRQIMPTMTEAVLATLGDAWPDLRKQSELVTQVTAAEENAFNRTLDAGLSMLNRAIDDAKQAGEPAIPAATAFSLHDTHGFPVDLTVEIAAEHGLDLDREAFASYMEDQRARARAAARGAAGGGVPVEVYREAAQRTGAVAFVGYSDTATETRIGALALPSGLTEAVGEGDEVDVVLPRTPFYAEGGGQLGDHGSIATDTGRLAVTDTISPVEGMTVHRARVVAGELSAGQDAYAEIDTARRAAITRGHTATHILHASIREVIGDHAAQAGSAIDAGHFRFDFPHFEAVSADQIAEIEQLVNERIASDPEISTVETTQEQARAMGAIALFGEKYGERVRVVQIGDFSAELCGGTHVRRAPEVGLFTVLSEGSVAANLRRIEAVTGPEAFTYLSKERLVANQVAQLLKVSTDELPERVSDLLERLRSTEKALERARTDALLASADQLVARAEAVGDARVLATSVAGADREGLKTLGTELRNRLGVAVVVLGTCTSDGKAALFAAVAPELAGRGVEARAVLGSAAEVVGGGAGGDRGIAQAGGKRGDRLDEAVDVARQTARDLVAGP